MSATQIVTHPEPFKLISPPEQQANRESLDQIRDTLQQGMGMVRESVTALNDFVVTGKWMQLPVRHDTVEEFIEAEFGFLPELALPVPERRSLVTLMAAAEMSQKAIAGRLGVDQATVSRDFRHLDISQPPGRLISQQPGQREREHEARLMIAAFASAEQVIKMTSLKRSAVERLGAEVHALEEVVRNHPPVGPIPSPPAATSNSETAQAQLADSLQAGRDQEVPVSIGNTRANGENHSLRAEVANLARERDGLQRRVSQLTTALHKNKIPVPAEPGASAETAAAPPAADARFLEALSRMKEAKKDSPGFAAGVDAACRLYLMWRDGTNSSPEGA